MPSATPRRKRGGAGAGASNGVANGTMSAKRAGKGKGKGKRGASPSAAPARANGGSRRVNSKPATGSASRDSTKRSRPRGSVSAFGGAPRHLAVHRCRFVDFVPSAIQCVAFDASGTLLAVARESGDVEVWSPECAWAPFMRVCVPKESAVRCLAWGAAATGSHVPRLFAGGLNGEVCEVDFEQHRMTNITSSYGGAVWSMALRPSGETLAVGCEDGAVRLFNVSGGVIEYDRSMPGSDARVLSVAWHPTEEVLFSGSSTGTILGWDVAARRAEVRIEVEALGKNASLVWALVVLSDFTVISGDSLGHVQIWDGRMGTLVHSFSQHKADVLSLTVTNNGVIPDASAAATEGGDGAGEGSSKRRPRSLRVFSAGVDGLVAAVRRVAAADGGPCRWVKAGGHHAHTHDVLSVAVSASGVVASGGLDSQLCVVDTTDVGQRQPRKFGPFPPWKLITAAMTPRLMMVQQPSQLDVWGLKRLPQTGSGAGAGAGAGSAANGGTIVASRRGSYKNKAQQPEELLLTLHAQGTEPILASALSPDGAFLAVSDATSLRVYALDRENKLKPTRVALPAAVSSVPSLCLRFAPIRPRLMVGTCNARVLVLDISGDAEAGYSATLASDMAPPTAELPATGRSRAASTSSADSDSSSGSDSDGNSDGDSDGEGEGEGEGSSGEEGANGDAGSDAGSAAESGDESGSGSESDDEDGDGAAAAASGAAPAALPTRLMHQLSRAVCKLEVSCDGQWLVAVDLWNDVHVFSMDSMRFHLSLPRLPAPVTALAFQHTGATVAVVTATNALSMYDADTGRMTEWSQQNAGRLPGRFTRKAVTDPVRHITFNPGTSLLVLAGHAYLGVVDVSKPIPPQAEPEANRRRHKKPRRSMLTPAQNGHDAKRRHAPADDEPPQNFRLVTRYGPTLFSDFLSHDEMVVVEVPWVRAVQHLPPALHRKRYGV